MPAHTGKFGVSCHREKKTHCLAIPRSWDISAQEIPKALPSAEKQNR